MSEADWKEIIVGLVFCALLFIGLWRVGWFKAASYPRKTPAQIAPPGYFDIPANRSEFLTEENGKVTISYAALLRMCDSADPPFTPTVIPKRLHRHFKTLTFASVSELLMDNVMSPNSIDKDILRIISICAARQNVKIPKQLVLVDSIMLGMLVMVESEMTLVLPTRTALDNAGLDNTFMLAEPGFKEAVRTKHIAYLVTLIRAVSHEILICSNRNTFPSLEIMRDLIVRRSNSTILSEDELVMTARMITAFAILSGVYIPSCYVVYDPYTSMMLKELTPVVRPKLTII